LRERGHISGATCPLGGLQKYNLQKEDGNRRVVIPHKWGWLKTSTLYDGWKKNDWHGENGILPMLGVKGNRGVIFSATNRGKRKIDRRWNQIPGNNG